MKDDSTDSADELSFDAESRIRSLEPDGVAIHVVGIPPHKDIGRSIRNSSHPRHDRFLALRSAADVAMNGRRWHDGPVEITFLYMRNMGDRPLLNYLEGISDTLGGSHGMTFTHIPIVYQDDCQIVTARARESRANRDEYVVMVRALQD